VVYHEPMPKFVKVSSPKPAVDYLAETLTRHVAAGERVLWLVAGGSAIGVAADVARRLSGQPLESLTVSLTDERPGPVGHPDSNWRGLTEAGFALPGAHLMPVLTGADTAADTAAFGRFLAKQLEAADFRLGLFGIGPDGHTAGLPAQNAAPSTDLAAYYEAGPFHRISSTPAAIGRLDEAVAYVMGENKHTQLDRLQSDLPSAEQSAQALKLVPKLTIFNDYKGEAA
jgi:6-phosphogluconolactonase/glucosamine-6-phosphate isomerase/deaminase